ncbi:MAG: hypothetical protein GX886_08745 [Comamonadaceae bacterium]|nr:hypothetical protein [Comamonadaceae bacterium]
MRIIAALPDASAEQETNGHRRASTQDIRAKEQIMGFHRHLSTAALAAAAALTLGAAGAWAQVSPTQEDRSQLAADRAALARERAGAAADEARLRRDKAEGRMAAESKDSMRVYRDQRAITGIKKDLAHDRPGTLQDKTDRAFLAGEHKALASDTKRLERNRAQGRMEATSPDAARVQQDRRAIAGQEKAIAEDKADLRADQRKK